MLPQGRRDLLALSTQYLTCIESFTSSCSPHTTEPDIITHFTDENTEDRAKALSNIKPRARQTMQLLSLSDNTDAPGSTNSYPCALAHCSENVQGYSARGEGWGTELRCAHRIKVIDLKKGSSVRECSLLMNSTSQGPEPS